MIRGYYVLDANKRTRPTTWDEWFPMFATGVTVGDNELTIRGERVRVLTIFHGADVICSDESVGGPPLLFDTIIFGGKHDGYQEARPTWNEAVEQHQVALDLVTEQVIA